MGEELKDDEDIVELKVWLIFTNGNQLGSAIRDYAIHNGHDIIFVKNDIVRIRAICSGSECF